MTNMYLFWTIEAIGNIKQKNKKKTIKKNTKRKQKYMVDENIAFYPIIRCAGKIWPGMVKIFLAATKNQVGKKKQWLVGSLFYLMFYFHGWGKFFFVRQK